MDVYGEEPETWDKRSKSDDTPVTKADLMADELIRTRLRQRYPDIPIISEEAEHLPFEERQHFEYFWVVDPLDGTKEFINRTGDFAVMIALCLRGSPVLGVIHAPARDPPQTFYAVDGQGAFVLPGGACGKGLGGSERVRCRSFSARAPGLTMAVSSSRPPAEFIAAFENPVVHRIGSSALKAMAVAEGAVDIYPCFSPTSEWDTCASHIIVKESGGALVRCTGSFERGMTDIAPFLQRAANVTSTSTAAQGDTVHERSYTVHDLRVVYNKPDLASPRCIFLGSCDA
ncbi:unnamed protein product [Ascophyllum nodosum]